MQSGKKKVRAGAFFLPAFACPEDGGGQQPGARCQIPQRLGRSRAGRQKVHVSWTWGTHQLSSFSSSHPSSRLPSRPHCPADNSLKAHAAEKQATNWFGRAARAWACWLPSQRRMARRCHMARRAVLASGTHPMFGKIACWPMSSDDRRPLAGCHPTMGAPPKQPPRTTHSHWYNCFLRRQVGGKKEN